MKRHLAAIATAAIAASSVAIAVAPGASAAAQAPIRTYHYSENFNLTGLGRDAGWYYRGTSSQVTSLSGRLARSGSTHEKYFNSHDKLQTVTEDDYIVDGRYYVKSANAKTWTTTKATAAEQREDARALDPYDVEALFNAIPGVRLVATGHYRVTGTPAQVGSFLNYEYGITAKDLTEAGIKSVTVNLFAGPAGRPLEFSVSAHSSLESVAITEKFFDYNKPVSIKAP
jgi:hypothetical protein